MNLKTLLDGHRNTAKLAIAITLTLLMTIGSLTPVLVQGTPSASPRSAVPGDFLSASQVIHRTLTNPLQGWEGVGDAAMFMVANDGSLTSLLFCLGGDIGSLNPTASHYQHVFMAALIMRWGEYESVLDRMFDFLGVNTTTGGGDGGFDITTFLSMLPSGILLIVFTGGTPSEVQAWGASIAQEFQDSLGVPFIRLMGIPPIPFEGETLAVEAYTCMLSEEGGRDAFQDFMGGLESTRQGMAGLVTPTLASDSIGGIGLMGLINASFGDGGTAAKTSKQGSSNLMPAIAWFSSHRDKFFGKGINTFNLNDFTGHSGSLSMGSLEFMEFAAAFPPDVTVTGYDPADMEVNATSDAVYVYRSTSTWESTPTVSNIIIDFQGSFPPALLITKTITPDRVMPGGTVQVTLTLKNNESTETVYNIHVDDSHSWDLYLSTPFPVTVTGDTSASYTSLGPGDTVTLTYQVRLPVEGSYISQPANVIFEDSGGTEYHKTTNKAYAVASYSNVIEFLLVILSSLPLSLPLLLIFGLMALYFVIWLIKGILGLRKKSAPPTTTSPEQPPTISPAPPPETPGKEAVPPPPPPPAKPAGEYCFNCGSPIPEGVEFCPACGAKLHK